MEYPNARKIPHVRVVKPVGTQGLLMGSRNSKFFITMPGEEEREIPTMRSAELMTGYARVDEVKLTMLATLEIVYE